MNLFLPLGLLAKKIGEINCPGQGKHFLIAPRVSNSRTAAASSFVSLLEQECLGGLKVPSGTSRNWSLIPLIQDNNLGLLVIVFHESENYMRRPANVIGLLTFTFVCSVQISCLRIAPVVVSTPSFDGPGDLCLTAPSL